MENSKKEAISKGKSTGKNETKDRIMEVALDLFSKRGYQAVSIRDVCKEVGIKESTIYYHFKNKQDILDMILQKIEQLIQAMEETFSIALDSAKQVTKKDFCLVAVNYIKQYLLEPNVHKMISMLTIERLSDQKADKLYQKLLFDLPISHQEKIFTIMYQRGMIENADAHQLAYEYNAIIYYAYQRYCFGNIESKEFLPVMVEEVTNNMESLYDRMRVLP